MATLHKEIEIERDKDFVWDAIRDVGAIHKRLVPGFVVDCKLEGDWRTVTFANGMAVRELIVSVDDKTCRHAWSVRGGPFTHHNASVQVFSSGNNKCRVVWIADFMPNEVTGAIGEMIQQGLSTMKRALESGSAGG
jgi:carbon monoxide dehydrogenase subunit G